MFVLRTGLQGNGKTLNTIKEVDKKAAAEGRTVYYHNIRDFKPNHEALEAVWQEFDKPEEWYLLPNNAIAVIDEAQTFFRVRPQGSKVPEYASALETMRHRGHELHCITQNPTLIDSHFRKLCNSHIHYVRGHKGKVIKRWEFEQVVTDVEKKQVFSQGEATRILIDPKYFGVYKSVAEGSTHHFKFKPPRALFVFGICLIVIAALSYRFYTHRIAPTAKPTQSELVMPGEAPSMVSGSVVPLTPEQYVDARIPRVPDVPSSAPIYDQITQAVSYPKAFCVSTRDEALLGRASKKMVLGYKDGRLQGCRCNTQQGTRVDVSFDACMAYVENGAFDPAKPDRETLPIGQPMLAGAIEERDATASKGVSVTVVESGKPGLLW
jgi:hypothetical protein